jgi:hypothetical protein
MSSISDLADLITAHALKLERAFDGEIARLRTVHGSRAVDEALRIVEQRDHTTGVSVGIAQWYKPTRIARGAKG